MTRKGSTFIFWIPAGISGTVRIAAHGVAVVLLGFAYQPPVHTTVPGLRAALKRPHNARTSQTKHTQPITRSHGLPDVLWITRVGLRLAEWHHFVPGIFGQYH